MFFRYKSIHELKKNHSYPTAKALKLCPQLVLRPGRMDVYRQESQFMRELFIEYTALIEPLSLDEAYLDVTDSKGIRCQ